MHIVDSLVNVIPDGSSTRKLDESFIKDQIKEAVKKSVLRHRELGELTLSNKTRIKVYICSPYGVDINDGYYEVRLVCKIQLECGIQCSDQIKTLYKCVSESVLILINNEGAIIANPINLI